MTELFLEQQVAELRESLKTTIAERDLARSNASVANQHAEQLATQNAELRRERSATVSGTGAIIEALRQRVHALELEVTLLRAGHTGTQSPGEA